MKHNYTEAADMIKMKSESSENKKLVINSREDVIKVINELCKWLEANDPASPARYHIEMAKECFNMDYWESVDAMKEISEFISKRFVTAKQVQTAAAENSSTNADGKQSGNNTVTGTSKKYDSLAPDKKLIETSSIFSK